MNRNSGLILVVLLLMTFGATAGEEGSQQALPVPEPGYLEVIQMTAVELDGRLPGGAEAVSFQWSIVEGVGGRLFEVDKPDAVFLAPKVERGTLEFLIELTVNYREQPPSTRRLRIRVFSEEAAKAADGSGDDTQWLQDYYKRARDKEDQQKSQAPTLIVPNSSSSMSFGVHRGWGGGWGGSMGYHWTMSYPITQPVDVPPPGETHQPGEGAWDMAKPVPYGELDTRFPSSIADRYSPADDPQAKSPEPESDPAESDDDR
jgi:hypothetical protein